MNDGWKPLVITLAIQALATMAVMTIPSMAPPMAQALSVSTTYLGIYIALAYAAAIAASLGAGAAVARYGAIRVSQACLVVCATGLALSAVPTVWATAAGAIVIGLGYGPVTPASSHLLARTTPPHRMSMVFSIKQTGVPVGAGLAGAIVPSLQTVAGWQLALLTVAVAGVACALLAQPLRAESDTDRDPTHLLRLGQLLEPMRLVLSVPALRVLAGCSMVFSMAQVSFTTYLVTYLTDSLAYGLVAAGALLALAQVAAVVGRVLWGYVADRWWGARATLALLALVMTAAAVATGLLQESWPTPLVVLVLLVYGASAIGWNGVALAEVARRSPEGQAGLATGGTLAITFAGVLLGPPVFGALAGIFAYRAGFLAMAVPLAACAIRLWRR